MGSLVSIQGKQIDRIEYGNAPVVTLSQIDEVHNRPKGTADRNFRRNIHHFINGHDFFKVNNLNHEIRGKKISNRGLILLTESGYLMIVKSFTDELSWKVQRELVNVYFRGKAPVPQIEDKDLRHEVQSLREELQEMKQLLTIFKPARMKTHVIKPENRNFLYDKFMELYDGKMSLRTWMKMSGCPLHPSIVSSALYQNNIPGELGLAILMKYLKFSQQEIRAKLIEMGKGKGIAELLA